MKKSSLLLLISLLFSFSYNAQNKNVLQDKVLKKIKRNQIESIITLEEGENIFDKNHDLNLTFKEIVSDHRCPSNAKCKEPGEAIVKIELMSVYSRPQTFLLSTNSKNEKSKTPRYVIFSGYEVSIVELLPFPEPRNNNNSPTLKLRVKKIALRSGGNENQKFNLPDSSKKDHTKLLENNH